MISLRHISYSYPRSPEPVLTDFNLDIPRGRRIAIIGPDGAGKSTLGKLIKGLIEPSSGEISGRGDPVADVGYVGGDPSDWIVGLSVEEDTAFGLEAAGLPPEEMERRIREALDRTGLTGLEERLTHTLSGGERQKTVLAGLLAMGASTLVLDDAFSMLDRSARGSVRSLLEELRRSRGLTVIEITDRLEDAIESDRLIYLASGADLFDGSPRDFATEEVGKRWIAWSGGGLDVSRRLFERGFLGSPLRAGHDLLTTILNGIDR